MVHEGFSASTGRTVLVRIDDLTPNERAEVCEFFRLVQEARTLADRPHGHMMSAVAMGVCAVVIAGGLGGPTWAIGAGALSVIGSMVSYGIANGYARKHMGTIFEGLLAIAKRNERCHIAASQLRQASAWYAKLLPEISAQPVAS